MSTLRYHAETTNDRGEAVRVEIDDPTWTGASTEVRLLDYALTTDSDDGVLAYAPVRPSAFTATLHELPGPDGGESSGALWAYLDADDLEARVTLRVDGAVVCVGHAETITGPPLFEINPPVTLTAHDGLAFLKDVTLDPVTGSETVLRLLSACLERTRTGLDVTFATRWSTDLHPRTALNNGLLDRLTLPATSLFADTGVARDAEWLLVEIARALHLEVRQSRGAWHVAERSLKALPYVRVRAAFGSGALSAQSYDPRVSVTGEAFEAALWQTDVQPRVAALRTLAVTFPHGAHRPAQRGSFGERPRSAGTPRWSLGTPFEAGADARSGYGGVASLIAQARAAAAARPFPVVGEDFHDWRLNANPAPLTINTEEDDGGGYIRLPAGQSNALSNTNATPPAYRGTGGARLRVMIRAKSTNQDTTLNFRVSLIPLPGSPGARRWLTATGAWVFSMPTSPLTFRLRDEEWRTLTLLADAVPEDEFYHVALTALGNSAEDQRLNVFEARPYYFGRGMSGRFTVTAARAAAGATLPGRRVLDYETKFGTAPVYGSPGGFGVLIDGDPYTGTIVPAYGWKASEYAANVAGVAPEASSGKPLEQVLAEEICAEQPARLRVLDVGFDRSVPRVWPDQVLVVSDGPHAGTYEVGAMTYDARGQQAGTWVPLVRAPVALTITAEHDFE